MPASMSDVQVSCAVDLYKFLEHASRFYHSLIFCKFPYLTLDGRSTIARYNLQCDTASYVSLT